MKILCLTPWYPAHENDKEGNFVRDSVEALGALGHEVRVLVTRPWRPFRQSGRSHVGGPGKKAVQHQLRYLSLPRNRMRPVSNWLYKVRVAGELERHARAMGAEVIHVHTELPALTAVPVARRMGIPVVVTLHGINPDPRLNSTAQHAALRNALGQAESVILVGEPLRAFFAPIVGRSDHFQVVHNGFRMPARSARPGPLSWHDPVRLVSVSNLHEGKGIELTLEALARLNAAGITHWRYTVIGGGYLEAALREKTGALGLQQQVRFAGPQPHNEVYRALQESDIFVLPSYREAFGIAYLEAMACGLLTIGVQGQGPSAFIESGRTGLLVAPRNVEDLAHHLSRALGQPAAMADIALRGQEHVRATFTWGHHAAALTRVYQQVVEERPCVRTAS